MSNSTNDFPDLNHFNKIREHLWCGREFGQAAVMIGSGFSTNAEKVNQSTPDMPLWKQLAREMYRELYPENPDGEEQAVSNALGLASEYKAAFGADALNSFLIQAIPDQQYRPGKLHKLLMALPWSDVFTTNYDTLLERTQPFIHDRKYDVVHTDYDIPRSMKPRIVKLHGSFPSHQPFILTEEDYRTYPTNFAPFVNTVQQSIMENIFCLIGFSGEDPNFLNWIGWVRDNLGDSQPPIYLCGLLSRITEAKKQVLRSKNIITVDVSPLFPRELWPDSNYRHAKATEWFLLSLMQGKPPNLTSWPEPSNKSEWQGSGDLPPLVPAIEKLPRPKLFQPNDFGQLSEHTLNLLVDHWRSIREAYPGWIICPRSMREEIWQNTRARIEQVCKSVNSLSEPNNLFLLNELNWRLEITLAPLFANCFDVIERELSRYNPYPLELEMEEADIKPNNESFKNLNWSEIQYAWVALAFALIRDCREYYEEDKFNKWVARIEKIASYRSEWQSRLAYEKCLFHLSRFEDQKVAQVLDAWPSSPNPDFWEVKKASILAELGSLNEAESIAESALTAIRSRIQPYEPDCRILSEEAWTMHLLLMIRRNQMGYGYWMGNYRDRWQKLSVYKCDVWTELEYFKFELDKQPPRPQPAKTVKKGYFPKTQTTSYQFAGTSAVELCLPGLAYLRMQEESATPLRCGMVTNKDPVLNASMWAIPFSTLWAITSVLRTEVPESIKSILSFVYVQALEEKHWEKLYRLLHSSLISELLGRTSRDSRSSGYLQARIHGAACFSIRCSPQKLRDLVSVAVDLYKSCLSKRVNYRDLFDSVNHLFKSVAYTFSDIEILESMTDFLSIPLPENSHAYEFDRLHDIFFYINFSNISSVPNSIKTSNWNPHIEHLILVVKNGKTLARCRAVRILNILHFLDALSEPQKSLFAEAIWSKIDEVTHLPEDTPLHEFGFLKLPEATSGQAKQAFKQYLSISELPALYSSSQVNGQEATSTSGLDHILFLNYLEGSWDIISSRENKNIYIDWSDEEVVNILNKFSSWWHQEKEGLLDSRSSLFFIEDTIQKSIYYYLQVLAKVILPRIANCREEQKEVLRLLIDDIESSGLCVLLVLPMTLLLDPGNINEVAQKTRIALASTQEKEVKMAMWGLLDWLLYNEFYNLPKPPAYLLDDLVSRILTRASPMLDCALKTMSSIAYRIPHVLTDKHLTNLYAGLDCLLRETRIPTLTEIEFEKSRNALIAVEDRPEYREHASRLAFSLYRYCVEQNKTIPNTLVSWRKASESDSLPSVRKIWHGIEQAHSEQEQQLETLREQIAIGTEQIQQGKVANGEATFDHLQTKIDQIPHSEE